MSSLRNIRGSGDDGRNIPDERICGISLKYVQRGCPCCNPQRNHLNDVPNVPSFVQENSVVPFFPDGPNDNYRNVSPYKRTPIGERVRTANSKES